MREYSEEDNVNCQVKINVNCQVKINKNSHIKLSNYSQVKNKSLSVGIIQHSSYLRLNI